ncbi:hypothetical protein SAMN05444397_101705 [Flavobacterium aquidurense]|uniref:Uncharacterized protein n=1 Tax=Flavobacterium frigidimaris TaxID=262320 RepID=A0ABX4BTM3_FLAFR|nr:hypothetical protein [Flavobacterium frigidimaris]OXA80996.1 hypothetical protein B0A65_05350 [Flavobacterium frigidimaris]SDY46296.1 hypothetical protein SAMN05444397_101705 [Flavobacterium aquidurense]
MNQNVQYRIYKFSIQIFFFSYVGSSKVYKIEPGKSTILPGLKYSFVTLLLGWWVFSVFHWLNRIKNSLTALHINFHGGEDETKRISEWDCEPKTIWIYNNLSREITSKLTIENLDVIVELQEKCVDKSFIVNISFLNNNLKAIGVVHLFNNDLEEIIETYKRFETRDLIM